MYGNNNYQPYYYGNYGGSPNYMQRAYNSQPQTSSQIPMQMGMGQQMPPTDMLINDIKYVNRAQAEAYIAFPNTKVMLIDRESGIVYIKTADGMGQSKTDYFRFEPINADGSPIKPQETMPQVDFNDYIKREEIPNLGFATVAQYNDLAQKLEQIQKQLVGGRPNVGQPKQPNQ